MIIKNEIQGSEGWHKLRTDIPRTASRAASATGQGKYQSRNELLAEIHSGITPDNSDKDFLFAKGHKAEANARPIAEEIIGEEIYPITATSDDEYLLASLDGWAMMSSVNWEHKLINDSLRKATADTLEEHYKIQMDQGMAVTGADKCLFMASDGTKADCNWFWYERDESRIQAVIAGWKQFDKDLAEFQPTAKKVEAVGAAVDRLPALFIDLEGDVKGSNLATYQQAVLARIDEINTDLKTDQDFADAEKMVKFLGDAEKEIENVKAQALAKTASIDDLFRTVDSLSASMRDKRLDLNKRVTERKKEVKLDIAQAARKSVDEHITKLNEGLGGNHMPSIATDFNTAMKGKKTVTSLQSAADDEVARAKIQANETAELIRANLKQLDAVTHPFLFNDRSQLLLKASDDLATLIIARESEHEKAEAKRVEDEREKIRAEEAAKLAAQQAKPEPEATKPAPQQAPKSEPVNINTQAKRPTDAQIISVLALHYRVHESKVITWLIDMDLDAESEKLASNF